MNIICKNLIYFVSVFSVGLFGPLVFCSKFDPNTGYLGYLIGETLSDAGVDTGTETGTGTEIGTGTGTETGTGTGGPTIVTVATKADHACALLSDRNIRCWGKNDRGQLGYGNTVSYSNVGDDAGEYPYTVGNVNLGDGILVQQVVVGDAHTCVLLSNDNVRCWGKNDRGQLGYGHSENLGDGIDDLMPTGNVQILDP